MPKVRRAEIDEFVGSKIRETRSRVGMSQTTLGGAVQVTFQQIQKLESGKNRTSVAQLIAIAEALGVPVTDLIPAPDEDLKSLEKLDSSLHFAAVDIAVSLSKMKPRTARACHTLIKALASEENADAGSE